MDIELLSYKISRLNMANKLNDSCNLKLVNSVSSECDWSDRIAVITLTETLRKCGKYPDQFYIELTLEGVFLVKEIKNLANKKEIYVRCYQELLSYANAILSMLAENSGLEGLDIRQIPLKPESVNFGPKPDAVKNEKIVRLSPNNR